MDKNTSNFFELLKGLSQESKHNMVESIFGAFSEKTANDEKFYQNVPELKETVEKLITRLKINNDAFMEACIRVEASSPYSIFSYLMMGNYSDFVFYKDGIVISNGDQVEKYRIDEKLQKIYTMYVEHFIKNIIFLAKIKFDMGHPIVDSDIDIFRFNLIHKSLTSQGGSTIIIRKQTINKEIKADNYIDGIGASHEQKEYIDKFSLEGNVIVFGATGSGKTTLLKHMNNYKLEEKRNLITIEDTKELNVDVPIALVTNEHKSIKDLFTSALRQHPSHICIGETRNDSIIDILEASLTVSVLTSIHANSLRRAIERIVFMSLSRGIKSQDVKELISSSVDCFIFMKNRKINGMWVKKEGYDENIYNSYEEVK